MLRKLFTASIAFALLAMASTPIAAAPCKDAKGKFTKCPPAATTAASTDVKKDKNGKCHIASGPKKGQFTKCP